MKRHSNVTLHYFINSSIDNIVSWNIYHDYLLFKTDKREEDKQYIYIVCFKDNFKEIKVLNFMPDPSCKIS